jgi:hypothetical protein
MKRAMTASLSIAATAIVVATAGACSRTEQLVQSRGRANEAAAIATLRTVLSAEAAYAASNGGGYGSLECLSNPKPCSPADPGQAYLDKGFVAGARNGYEFEFFAGSDAPGGGSRPAGSSLSSFAVVASPAAEDSPNRRFCGDSSMNVCALEDDGEPAGGACPATCKPLQ